MRGILLRVLPLLIVAACQSSGPIQYLHKPGVGLAGKQAALDQCKIASFREVPQTLATETTGGYYNPGTVQCSSVNGLTTCNTVGAVNIPATSSTYDTNAALRGRYINRCLRAKGFSITVLQPCQGDAAKKAARLAEAEGRIPACSLGSMLDG